MRTLYHGTDDQSAELIKKNGFVINQFFPENNYFGAGVYLTDDKEIALFFAEKARDFKKGGECVILTVNVNTNIYIIKNMDELDQLIKDVNKKKNNTYCNHLTHLGFGGIDASRIWNIIGVSVFDPKNVTIYTDVIFS